MGWIWYFGKAKTVFSPLPMRSPFLLFNEFQKLRNQSGDRCLSVSGGVRLPVSVLENVGRPHFGGSPVLRAAIALEGVTARNPSF